VGVTLNGKDNQAAVDAVAKVKLFDALMEATNGKLTLKQASEIWEKMNPKEDYE
jgi:hypothetical protein